MHPIRRTVVPAVAGTLLLAGCGSGSSATSAPAAAGTTAGSSTTSSPPASSSTGSNSAGSDLSGTVTVLAAASLTGSFTQLGKQFEAAHPGVTVRFSFGPSSGLAESIVQGAPADVFASASAKNMDQVVAGGAAASPTTFATNVMEIAVPPSNPGKVRALADLANKGVKVALCQAQVPCGVTAAQVLSKAKLTVKPVTLEADVKATLTKVQLGSVDAGVVYVTDVRAAGSKVKGIAIPAAVNASTSYPVAALTKAPNAAGAAAFVAYVLSADGVAALTAAGFGKP